jgi:hypothetical protein
MSNRSWRLVFFGCLVGAAILARTNTASGAFLREFAAFILR